jgi:hypothetical protein
MKKPPTDKVSKKETGLNGNELANYVVTNLADIVAVIRLNGGKINQYYYAYTINHLELATHSGITDLLLMCPNGDVIWLECKGIGDTMKSEQNEFKELCIKFSHIHRVVDNQNYLDVVLIIRDIYKNDTKK